MQGGFSRTSILPYSPSGANPGSCRLFPNYSYWMRWRSERLYGKKANTEFSVRTEVTARQSRNQTCAFYTLADNIPEINKFAQLASISTPSNTESERRAWHYLRLANSVSPLRGSGLGVNVVPPLPQWAKFFRPSGTGTTSEGQAWNIFLAVDHMLSVQAWCST
jgi:hypothetical protein